METRFRHIMIGLFTVLAFFAILMFALWLGKTASDRDYTYYEIGFERAVSGLSEGSSVLYSGIKVGDVLSLQLDQDDPRHVRARIRVFKTTPIKEDTRAKLELANITGGMVVQLHGGTPESPRLPGDYDDPPVIPGDPSPLSALLTDGEEIIGNLNQLLENAARLLSEDNATKVSQILDDVGQTTRTFAEHRGELGESLQALNQLLTDAGTLVDTVNQLVDADGRQALASARQAMHTLEVLLDENQSSLDRGLKSVGDLGPAIRDFRSALRAVQQVAERLDDNATEFLFGSDQIQEYSP
ncbi:MlaD family protein [Marinimicrobium sp. ABcell2]|uniref:MlaD family protein n=1 Tax=Marinimicrobium sp. ABcell2 TaxID=3069751 RepID=UPI0027AE20AB|nr:MlaD family protein [Marinimicrobium sp. ABcell2]MDQ2076784.1 MlaD family protein [Marinimicrobium sp. ABcell2]